MRVFLCHASEDKPVVRQLAERLRANGFEPWLDEERLLPGQDWKLEIDSAVQAADAIVVCISKNSLQKVGFVQKELRIVLDLAEHHPEGQIFVMPARLEHCAIPPRLKHLHCADLFEEGGYERLRAALAVVAKHPLAQSEQLKAIPLPPVPPDWRRRWWPWITVVLIAAIATLAFLYRSPKEQPPMPKSRASSKDLSLQEMIRIPSGTFLMGRNGSLNASPARAVTLPAYSIDRLPVTVQQFQDFTVRFRGGTADHTAQNSQWPMTNVTWDEAAAYCLAQGKRLPAEAEWEYAARGATGRLYPWGDQFSSTAVNSIEAGIGALENVGSRSLNRSPFGVLDLSGNVWQWCADDYHQPGIQGAAKVIRGGSYRADADHVTTTTRNFERPDTRSATIGFRCAQ